MSDLRDHSQPCDDKPGPYETNGGWWACTRCPGGREVTIDYEAAYAEHDRLHAPSGYPTRKGIRSIVDAAIGGDEVDYEVDIK